MPRLISDAKREAIIAAVNEGLDTKTIAERLGEPPGLVAAVRAHISRGTYDPVEAAEVENEVAEAVDTAFGLERDLQLALRQNIEQLEPGLTISDDGREQTVPSGRIDITARDRDGATVVIELKVGAVDRDAIGQWLAYMGDLAEQGGSVRGIFVARDFTLRLLSAARVVPNLRLVKYGFHFTFETMTGSRKS
jgi:endonuclease